MLNTPASINVCEYAEVRVFTGASPLGPRAGSLELVVVAVDDRRHCRDFFRKHLEIQSAVALLNHAAQQARIVDAAFGFVDGVAITPYFADVTLGAFVLRNQLFPQFQVGTVENSGFSQRARPPCGDAGNSQLGQVPGNGGSYGVFHRLLHVYQERGNARLSFTLSQHAVVKSPQSDRCVDIDELRLDAALTLIGQTGSPPVRDQMSTEAYVQAVVDALCQLSSHDVLTSLPNRRSFSQAMDRELDRVARSGDVALLLMVDVDHFKRVNDTYGHPAGDEVLRQVALRLLDCVRPMDTVARYGGEEFSVVLPNCSYTYGEMVAERIRNSMEAKPVLLASGQSLSLTVSVGGAYAPQWVRSDAAIWVERADRQLYRAKKEGRNRVCMEETIDTVVSNEEKELLFGALAIHLDEHIDLSARDSNGQTIHP